MGDFKEQKVGQCYVTEKVMGDAILGCYAQSATIPQASQSTERHINFQCQQSKFREGGGAVKRPNMDLLRMAALEGIQCVEGRKRKVFLLWE